MGCFEILISIIMMGILHVATTLEPASSRITCFSDSSNSLSSFILCFCTTLKRSILTGCWKVLQPETWFGSWFLCTPACCGYFRLHLFIVFIILIIFTILVCLHRTKSFSHGPIGSWNLGGIRTLFATNVTNNNIILCKACGRCQVFIALLISKNFLLVLFLVLIILCFSLVVGQDIGGAIWTVFVYWSFPQECCKTRNLMINPYLLV